MLWEPFQGWCKWSSTLPSTSQPQGKKKRWRRHKRFNSPGSNYSTNKFSCFIKEILLFVFCSFFFFFFFFFLFLLSICPTLISKGIRWQQNKNEKGKQERRTEKEVELAYHVFNCHLVSCGVVGYVCFDFINVITIPQQGSRFTGECISKGLK